MARGKARKERARGASLESRPLVDSLGSHRKPRFHFHKGDTLSGQQEGAEGGRIGVQGKSHRLGSITPGGVARLDELLRLEEVLEVVDLPKTHQEKRAHHPNLHPHQPSPGERRKLPPPLASLARRRQSRKLCHRSSCQRPAPTPRAAAPPRPMMHCAVPHLPRIEESRASASSALRRIVTISWWTCLASSSIRSTSASTCGVRGKSRSTQQTGCVSGVGVKGQARRGGEGERVATRSAPLAERRLTSAHRCNMFRPRSKCVIRHLDGRLHVQ
eukprot:scaffold1151_cov126-Isochrysis_galbana.AAC.15